MTHLTFKIQFLLIMYNCIMYINHVRSLVKNSSVLLNTIRVRLHDIKQQQSDVNKSFQKPKHTVHDTAESDSAISCTPQSQKQKFANLCMPLKGLSGKIH